MVVDSVRNIYIMVWGVFKIFHIYAIRCQNVNIFVKKCTVNSAIPKKMLTFALLKGDFVPICGL